MASHRVERILEGLDAFNRGDFETAIAEFPEDVDWGLLAQMPETEPLRGKEQILRFWNGWSESFSDFRAELEEVVDEGDHVIVVMHMSGRLPDTAVVMTTPTFAQLWTWRGDEIVRVQMFQSKQEALSVATAAKR